MSSDEEGEVVFKNTKQKGSRGGDQVEYGSIRRTPHSDSSEDGEEEFDDSYDRLPHLKDSVQTSKGSRGTPSGYHSKAST